MLATKEMPDTKIQAAAIASRESVASLEEQGFFGRTLLRGKLFLRAVFRWAPLLVVLTLARSTLADQYHVPTSSMWPTIEPGDRIFVSKAAYGLRIPFTDTFLTGEGEPESGEV